MSPTAGGLMDCPTNRECYPSQKSANTRLAEIRKKSRRHTGKRRKIPKRAYWCHLCGQWHLTSQDRKNREWPRRRKAA